MPKGRISFCSDRCVDSWKIRSQPGYVRHKLFERDKGVCALCRVDTVKQAEELEELDFQARDRWNRSWYGRQRYRDSIEQNDPLRRRLEELGIPSHRYYCRRGRGIWDADHIVAVIEGGGECGLDNYRTLCCRCHKVETAKLRSKRKKHDSVLRLQLRPQLHVHNDVRLPGRHQDRPRQLGLFDNLH